VWLNPGTTLHNYRRFGFLKLENTPFPELNKLSEESAAARKAKAIELLSHGPTAIMPATVTTSGTATR
jgi:hypothetical protein